MIFEVVSLTKYLRTHKASEYYNLPLAILSCVLSASLCIFRQTSLEPSGTTQTHMAKSHSHDAHTGLLEALTELSALLDTLGALSSGSNVNNSCLGLPSSTPKKIGDGEILMLRATAPKLIGGRCPRGRIGIRCEKHKRFLNCAPSLQVHDVPTTPQSVKDLITP